MCNSCYSQAARDAPDNRGLPQDRAPRYFLGIPADRLDPENLSFRSTHQDPDTLNNREVLAVRRIPANE